MDFQWVLVPLLGDLVRYQAMFFPFPPTCEVSNIHARRKSTRIMLLPAKLQEARDMVLQGGPLPLAVFVVLTTIDFGVVPIVKQIISRIFHCYGYNCFIVMDINDHIWIYITCSIHVILPGCSSLNSSRDDLGFSRRRPLKILKLKLPRPLPRRQGRRWRSQVGGVPGVPGDEIQPAKGWVFLMEDSWRSYRYWIDTGWWFQTWMDYCPSYMGCHPSHFSELHDFSRWLTSTTNQ